MTRRFDLARTFYHINRSHARDVSGRQEGQQCIGSSKLFAEQLMSAALE